MLKSCKYCGNIHDSKYDCGKKPRRKKIRTEQNQFRSTNAWKNKSIQIRVRDHYLCQVCIRNLYHTQQQYNDKDLEVHHIIPVAEDYDRRLDNENLITLCEYHHEMSERGEIPREALKAIVRQQETNWDPPGGENPYFS